MSAPTATRVPRGSLPAGSAVHTLRNGEATDERYTIRDLRSFCSVCDLLWLARVPRYWIRLDEFSTIVLDYRSITCIRSDRPYTRVRTAVHFATLSASVSRDRR